MTAEPPTTSDTAAFLLQQIRRARALRLAHAARPDRAAKRLLLREWQAARLKRTYADLLDHPGYRAAAEFFLSDLYGLKDTSERDAAVERIYPAMVKMLPEPALHGIGLALELDALSEELDAQLLDVLIEQLGLRDQITEVAYGDAYRRCDNYALRKHQIELLTQTGEDLALIVSKPFLYRVLRAMRRPALVAGFGELQSFLERGFNAFRHLSEPRTFLETIERRETRILDRLYACHPRPFDEQEPVKP
ncbi:MAG TPA: hypothetical protein VMH26_03640 [Burkholderiales bacterium]|nr:hypothetical protein [Burkholderiales bacterium]